MPSVLSIGSSLVDIFVQSDEFQLEKSSEGLLLCQRYGEKIEISDFSLHTGGGASNTAVGFVRLGMDASIIAELGRDSWSEIIAADLKKSNVRTDYMVVEKKEHTGGSVILIGKDGGRTVLVHRGAASQLDPQDVPPSAIEQVDWVHLSSISGRKETLVHIFSLLQRGERKLSWNPGKQELKLIAQAELDVSQIPCSILILNKQEWESVQTVAHVLKKQIPEI
ncbi:carbohydrate kinase family protein, partial [Candidatus Woesebacteria bacterium]|nr:carbohydrate kinase family protein [Candidatus Woesebacteria bacterium]